MPSGWDCARVIIGARPSVTATPNLIRTGRDEGNILDLSRILRGNSCLRRVADGSCAQYRCGRGPFRRWSRQLKRANGQSSAPRTILSLSLRFEKGLVERGSGASDSRGVQIRKSYFRIVGYPTRAVGKLPSSQEL